MVPFWRCKGSYSLYFVMEVKDSRGNLLNDGDSVYVLKDLKVKGMSATLKEGYVIQNIRLTGSPDEVACRIGNRQVVLKTVYLKKV